MPSRRVKRWRRASHLPSRRNISTEPAQECPPGASRRHRYSHHPSWGGGGSGFDYMYATGLLFGFGLLLWTASSNEGVWPSQVRVGCRFEKEKQTGCYICFCAALHKKGGPCSGSDQGIWTKQVERKSQQRFDCNVEGRQDHQRADAQPANDP